MVFGSIITSHIMFLLCFQYAVNNLRKRKSSDSHNRLIEMTLRFFIIFNNRRYIRFVAFLPASIKVNVRIGAGGRNSLWSHNIPHTDIAFHQSIIKCHVLFNRGQSNHSVSSSNFVFVPNLRKYFATKVHNWLLFLETVWVFIRKYVVNEH